MYLKLYFLLVTEEITLMKLSKALQSEESQRNYESKTVQTLITF